MEANIIQIILTLIVVALIGVMTYYQRKYGANPEDWDMTKFLLMLVVAVVVMTVEYFYGNSIQFPAEDILVPAMGLFGMVITLITGGRLVNQTVVPKVLGAPISISGWNPGYMVTPAETKGVSPVTAKLMVVAGVPAADHPGVVNVEIDWMDGSPKEMFQMPTAGFFEPTHTYSYAQGQSKYTGHQFYPSFRFIMSDGKFYDFNVDGKGVWIEVQSK
jgi:hypothetical protein